MPGYTREAIASFGAPICRICFQIRQSDSNQTDSVSSRKPTRHQRLARCGLDKDTDVLQYGRICAVERG
jgi:hypothetical protein